MKFDKFDKEKSIPHVLGIIEKLKHKSLFSVEGVLKAAAKNDKQTFIYAYETLADNIFNDTSKIENDIAFFVLKSMPDLIPKKIDSTTKARLQKKINTMLKKFEE